MKQTLRNAMLALCCGLTFAACSTQPATLKIMSYNIRNGLGTDGVQDLGRIAATIRGAVPDLVALQEVDSVTGRTGGLFVPAELGRMTGMHATFGRAIDFDGGSYGVGLLSRTEPLAVRRIPLPGREEARVLLAAEFPDCIVCVTHLSLTPEDREASLGIIRAATDTCRKFVLLAGDFNTDGAQHLLGGLGGTFLPLSDMAQATFPAGRPTVCIDYILGRNLPPTLYITERLVDSTALGSDHCPLLLALEWPR